MLGRAALAGQYVHHERKVDGHIHAEAEAADGHADEETAEIAGDGDHEQRQAVHDQRGQHENLPPPRPVREPPAGQRSRDEDGGLDECAEEYLLRHIGLGGAELVQQV